MGFAISFRVVFRAAVYMAVGALCYSAFVGPIFDWSAPMTYVWLLIWPLMLFLHFVWWLLALCLISVAVLGLLAALGKL